MPSRGLWPVILCWVAVALDGFDLVVLGAVIPVLGKSGALGFIPKHDLSGPALAAILA